MPDNIYKKNFAHSPSGFPSLDGRHPDASIQMQGNKREGDTNNRRPSQSLSRGTTALETLIILVFISILLIIGIDRFMTNLLSAKESLLHGELINIRMSIKLYRLMNGKYPESLSKLVQEEFLQPYTTQTNIKINDKHLVADPPIGIKDKYLITKSVDESGEPLDPFGNKYDYNKTTGDVKCTTKGYENW